MLLYVPFLEKKNKFQLSFAKLINVQQKIKTKTQSTSDAHFSKPNKKVKINLQCKTKNGKYY